jgi:hypothetical protein
MYLFPRLFYKYVVLCVGRGLTVGWSPIRGDLSTMCGMKKLKKRRRPNKRGCRCVVDDDDDDNNNNFMEHYGGKQLVGCSAISQHLWNPEVQYRVYCSSSWPRQIQPIPPHPISLICILILSSYVYIGHTSGLSPSAFPTKILHAFRTLLKLASHSREQMHLLAAAGTLPSGD